MTDKELKTLKDNLWHAADVLRSGAHLAANKYGQPILGLIFLRYADILFKQHKDEIDKEFARLSGTRMEKSKKEIAIEKCGFFLPECAYYDFLNDAPHTAEKANLVKKAMEAISSFCPIPFFGWLRGEERYNQAQNPHFSILLPNSSDIILKKKTNSNEEIGHSIF